ncbi:uncharacterized protein FTOL_08654 [Fusarium torulosum]|uniref:Uncharacterized protein n=1 Tax=Fusarium torulosum TaxID=33205 RepID=A0AAE8MEH4_9HYPO|nr:uncharacterized protein FTOL_08654 [Fusarium torulosum]
MATKNAPSVSTPSTCTSSTERSSTSTSGNSATNVQDTRFIDEEDDPLIPNREDERQTFREGKATWETFLRQAKKIPRGLWPTDALNPYVTLVDVPSLPEQFPCSEWLRGRPCWELSHDIGSTVDEDPNAQNKTSLAYGRLVSFQLQISDPIRCGLSPDATSYACSSPETVDSLAVLVMCWSYILSARLLEMQDLRVRYTDNRLWPVVSKGQQENTADIDLEGASPSLVRWLCAILSPTMGWQADGYTHLPPWAASFNTDIRLVVEAPDMAKDICSPPDSHEATALLIELCRLFDLGSKLTEVSDLEPLPPHKASFLAVLALPFYNSLKLQPQLPRPRLVKSRDNGTFNTSHEKQIHEYLYHVRYFMTFSAHPISIGSIIWSVFWQPDVDCNLVGPWLASVLETLDQTIAQKEVEVLLKVFLSRRPRIGLWWVALFLLGDPALFDLIRRYMTTLEEKYGFGSLSFPDPMVSAWTGSRQSFIDFDNDHVYMKTSDLVSAADLLRCRFNFKLQNSASTTCSWRPFGVIKKELVELESWPQLETKCTRRYSKFVWYLGKDFSKFDEGFRTDTTQYITNVPDNLEMHTCTAHSEKDYYVDKRCLSKKSTRNMMVSLVEDARGGRHWTNTGLQVRMERLRWLYEWEGLVVMEQAVDKSKQSMTEQVKMYSLVEGWLSGLSAEQHQGSAQE